MKKMDVVMQALEKKLDVVHSPFLQFMRKHFSVIAGICMVLMVALFFIKIIGERPYFMASIVHSDVKKIGLIIEKIDQNCKITAIAGGRTAVNFLTVKKFVGSVIGGLNLMDASKWAGQYVEVNPTIQQQFYDLVQAKDGCFVVPGIGVFLPNGYVVGKDFVITSETNVAPMMQAGGFLFYKGEPLAQRVNLKYVMSILPGSVGQKASTINAILQEFNQALPFAKNDEESTLQ